MVFVLSNIFLFLPNKLVFISCEILGGKAKKILSDKKKVSFHTQRNGEKKLFRTFNRRVAEHPSESNSISI